jgi:hypothetical protein
MDFLNSLLSGIVLFKVGQNCIFLPPPSAEAKAFADFFSYNLNEESEFDGWSKDDAVKFAIQNNLWSEEKQLEMDKLTQAMEDARVDYFNNFFMSSKRKTIGRAIEDFESKFISLQQQRSIYFDKTTEYLCSQYKTLYIVENFAKLIDGRPAVSTCSLQSLSASYTAKIAEISVKVRGIAKSGEWRNIWHGVKENCFENRPSSFTELQHSLICWSHYYDNIYQSMEKPSEEIIEDDFAIDGWSICERRKRLEEEKKKSSEMTIPQSMSKAGEVFIMASSKKDVEDIYGMNSDAARSKLRSLERDLNRNGVLEDSKLTANRLEIQMASTRREK